MKHNFLTVISATRRETKTWTQEAIEALPDDGYNHEVVKGELVMSPKNNPQHGEICARLFLALGNFVRERRLGVVWDSSTGFWMANGDCRAPDISFVSKERLQGLRRPATKFFQGAPDLAVEILAPSNTPAELRSRLADYFASGTRLAWIINPKTEKVDAYDSARAKRPITSMLDGGKVLPGFSLPIGVLFEEWDWK